MNVNKHPIEVGTPIPELNTSPIFLNVDAEREIIETTIPEERICYFNGESYPHGAYIKSGSMLLQCDRGAWIETEVPY